MPSITTRDLYKYENRFVASYIESLFWSSYQHDCNRPFDDDYDYTDLAQEALDEIVSDCGDFLDQVFNREDLADFVETMDYEQVAHDFCLTRNRHGAGFWDRGLGKTGQILTDISHVYGSQYPYVGDDGKIYLG